MEKKKIYKPVKDSLREIERFEVRNPFLAALAKDALLDKNYWIYTFGCGEVSAFIKACEAVPEVLSAKDEAELTASGDIFWKLVDRIKENPDSGFRHHGMLAIVTIFRRLMVDGRLADGFRDGIHSPYEGLKHKWFCDLLESPHGCRDNWFSFGMKNLNLCTPFNIMMDCKSPYLRDMIIRAYTKDFRLVTKKECRMMMVRCESWFRGVGTVMSSDDATVQRLDAAANCILGTDDTQYVKTLFLRFLFAIWREIMSSEPDRDFFVNSLFWRPEMVMHKMTPHCLARGYRIIPAGKLQKVGPYDRILFTATSDNFRSANGTGYHQESVNSENITNLLLKTAFVNYADKCVASGNRTYEDIRCFLKWLEKYGFTDRNGKVFISRRDTKEYRAFIICEKDIHLNSKRSYMNSMHRFLRWGEKSGYFEVEERALENDTISYDMSVYDKQSIPQDRIPELRKELDRLYEETGDICYLYTRIIFCLLLNCGVRVGEICAMKVSCITFRNDGSCSVHCREKNTGAGPVNRQYNAIAAGYIREAMLASKEIRKECPMCAHKDNVFLHYSKYDNNYRVLNRQMFNHYLKSASPDDPTICSGNARHTYMSSIKRLSRKLNLNTPTVLSLTGHARMETVNGYDNIELSDILEAADGLTIGTTERMKE